MAKILALQNQSETGHFLDAESVVGKSVLLSEAWPVPSILGAYVGFILVDSYILKERKPLDLKFFMMIYNVYQMFYNLYMFYQCLVPEAIEYYFNHSCRPMDPSHNHLLIRGLNVGFMFFLSKLTDLIDTLFIVLRKKHNQISFLHMYHHVGMVGFTWIMLRNYIGEQLIMIVLVNSFVHVVMYTYYALSLLGPSVQKHLWWKKYVTMLQMAQFLFIVVYMASLIYYECPQPKGVSFFTLTQGIIFFKLFKDFYDTKYQTTNSINQEDNSSKKKRI